MNYGFYTTKKETLTMDFVLAPSGRYVGWVVYNNGYFFSSAEKLEDLHHNIRNKIQKKLGNGLRLSLVLASKPTEREFVPLNLMPKKLKTQSYFNHKLTDKVEKYQKSVFERLENKIPVVKKEKIEKKINENKTIHFYEVQNGVLYVYEKKLVAKYEVEQCQQ